MSQAEPGRDKRRIVIEALLAGESQDAAAKLAGVSRRSVVRWLADSAFSDELKRARAAAFSDALAALKGGASLAVRTLLDVLKSTRPAERRQAAREILSFAFKGVELEEFEARLTRLEEHIEEHNTRPGRFS